MKKIIIIGIMVLIVLVLIGCEKQTIQCNQNETDDIRIKELVGKDKIQICDGKLWINKEKYDEKYDAFLSGQTTTIDKIYQGLATCQVGTITSSNNKSMQIVAVECLPQLLNGGR